MKRLLHGIRQLRISTSLQIAFLASALLTLFVSLVSLYSWHAQSSQVRFTLDDYLPRIQSSLFIENALNQLVNQLNAFVEAPDTRQRLMLRQQINNQLNNISGLSASKEGKNVHAPLKDTLRQTQQLLTELDSVLYNHFLAKEKVNELARRISWLHDDFTTELNSLMQDFSWQQGALINQMGNQDSRVMAQLQWRLRQLQQEQQQVYALARLEAQISDELHDQISELFNQGAGAVTLERHRRYLQYLQSSAADTMAALSQHSSTVTLLQTIEELLDIGLANDKLAATVGQFNQTQRALSQAEAQKTTLINHFRTLLEQKLTGSHQQMQSLNQRLEQIIDVSGQLIIVATICSLLLALLLNFGFIRSRLIRRFNTLSQAVAQIGTGDKEAHIAVYGVDELGRIARLLRRTLSQQQRQTLRLKQEIRERKAIEQHLIDTQEELIQTAKLAVVGQTMTTLAHELNQPLNALAVNLFTARNQLSQSAQTSDVMLQKCQALVQRMDGIIRRLRQFSRRAEEVELHPVQIQANVQEAWELLAARRQHANVRLQLPAQPIWVKGEEVRLQQILVNLLTNAIEAAQEGPILIQVQSWQEDRYHVVMLCDDGPGWALPLAERLLKPFTTNKSVGLGIGLSISASLMAQLKGELYLASHLPHGAAVLLRFLKVDAAISKEPNDAFQ